MKTSWTIPADARCYVDAEGKTPAQIGDCVGLVVMPNGDAFHQETWPHKPILEDATTLRFDGVDDELHLKPK